MNVGKRRLGFMKELENLNLDLDFAWNKKAMKKKKS